MKNECEQIHRGVFRLCAHHTLMLYQGSPLSLITQDSSELWGESRVNAWTHTCTDAKKKKKKKASVRAAQLTHKNVLCLIWFARKVNYLRELIDFMSTKVEYAKAV